MPGIVVGALVLLGLLIAIPGVVEGPPAAVARLAAVVVALAVTFVLSRRERPLARVVVQGHLAPQSGRDPTLQGEKLGGWLILPAWGLVVGPIVGTYNLVTAIGLLRELMRGGQSSLLRLSAVVVFSEAVLLIMMLAAASLFFARKVDAPRAVITLMLAQVCFVAYFVWIAIVEDLPADLIVGDLLRSLVPAAIWVPYFLVSQRVKRTFTVPAKVHSRYYSSGLAGYVGALAEGPWSPAALLLVALCVPYVAEWTLMDSRYIPIGLLGTGTAAQQLTEPFILSAAAVLAFRYIRPEPISIIAAALTYAATMWGLAAIGWMPALSLPTFEAGVPSWAPLRFLAFALILLSSLSVALRLIPFEWLALFVGAGFAYGLDTTQMRYAAQDVLSSEFEFFGHIPRTVLGFAVAAAFAAFFATGLLCGRWAVGRVPAGQRPPA